MRRKNTLNVLCVLSNTHCLTSLRVYSLLNNSTQPPARFAQPGYRHPLAQRDPSQRNIALPDSVHAKGGSHDKLPAEVLQRRAQKALLLRMQQEVLWEGTIIDNAEHSLIQHFRKLASNPKFRNARNMMIVGGREAIRELCEKGQRPRHLLVTEGKVIPEWAKQQPNMELVRVQEQVAEECLPGNDGFVGDFDIPPLPLKEELIANHKRLKRILVLDNVDDAGVLGTLLRTAVGLVYDAIIVINHCADLYDHQVVRAACGAHFQQGVPIYTLSDEDGDDVYGMLNHIIARNSLLPVCFTAHDDIHENDNQTKNNISNSDDHHSIAHMEEIHKLTTHSLEEEEEEEKKVLPTFTSSVVGAEPISLNKLARVANVTFHFPSSVKCNDNNFNKEHNKIINFFESEETALLMAARQNSSHNRDGNNNSVMKEKTYEQEQNACNVNWNDYQRSRYRRETLSEFCLQSFTAHRDGPDHGYMLITGPNHKRTMIDRLRKRVTAPLTQLLLDEIGSTDALVGYSVIMHALRPAGDWDYLPLNERTKKSDIHLQQETASVDIGADRMIVDESCINMDEEEQVQAAHERNLLMKWRRQKKRELTDYEHWMTAEEKRVKTMLMQQKERLSTPWKVTKRKTPSPSHSRQNIPDGVPNIIDDYRQPLDRTELREENSQSENYVRPSNYDKYAQRELKKFRYY